MRCLCESEVAIGVILYVEQDKLGKFGFAFLQKKGAIRKGNLLLPQNDQTLDVIVRGVTIPLSRYRRIWGHIRKESSERNI